MGIKNKIKKTNDGAKPTKKWIGGEHVGHRCRQQIKWLSFFPDQIENMS
jgi:hypothetical protein